MFPPRKRTSKNWVLSLLPIFALFLFLLSVIKTPFKKTPDKNTENPPLLHLHKHLQVAHSACEGTLYPELCVSTLANVPDLASKSVPQIISATVNHTVDVVESSASNCSGIKKKLRRQLDPLEKRALDDCLELFQNTISELETALPDLTTKSKSSKHYHDLQTLLSAAITNQYTCLDGFAYSDGNVRDMIDARLYRTSHLVSNALAMLKKIPAPPSSKYSGRREPFEMDGKSGFPAWMSRKDRRLLQAPVNETKFDLVVAKDGSGNFTTISEAVEAAPNGTTAPRRFVIYIKEGAYMENVEVIRKKTMLMFVGDGIEKTVVKASRNVVDGWTTFRSATVAVVGNGFIARDMSFENAAGPSKHQAVALRSGSDLSAFYRCSFVGYQDTLYVHSLRQFYKECDIYGTIDFIFGNAAAVFQDCNLYARKPNPNQRNIFTAQGREDPNQNTGISIIGGKVTAAADLIPEKTTFETYLGRPWKQYSRTVFMLAYIDDVVDPAGWLEWNGDFALDTLYYGEYMNRGPGSNTSSRVTWPGYRVLNASEASSFTVEAFIQGSDWLPASKIPFASGLSFN